MQVSTAQCKFLESHAHFYRGVRGTISGGSPLLARPAAGHTGQRDQASPLVHSSASQSKWHYQQLLIWNWLSGRSGHVELIASRVGRHMVEEALVQTGGGQCGHQNGHSSSLFGFSGACQVTIGSLLASQAGRSLGKQPRK